jgi:hypothetical protein
MAMEVKGVAVLIFHPFITEKYGQVGYSDWLASLSPESRSIHNQPIDPNAWYPIREAFISPTQAMCEQFYGGEPKGAWEIGHFSGHYTFRGFLRSILKLSSVRMFLLRSTAVMPTYYRPSALAVPEIGENRAQICITHFPEPHLMVDHRIAGWSAGALEAHGQREVASAVTKSLAKGDPYTEIKLTWK